MNKQKKDSLIKSLCDKSTDIIDSLSKLYDKNSRLKVENKRQATQIYNLKKEMADYKKTVRVYEKRAYKTIYSSPLVPSLKTLPTMSELLKEQLDTRFYLPKTLLKAIGRSASQVNEQKESEVNEQTEYQDILKAVSSHGY